MGLGLDSSFFSTGAERKHYFFSFSRYNLLNSAVIELLNFVRMENIKPLVSALVNDYLPRFETIKYVGTFQELKRRHEQNLQFERDGGLVGNNGSGIGDDEDTSWFRE